MILIDTILSVMIPIDAIPIDRILIHSISIDMIPRIEYPL